MAIVSVGLTSLILAFAATKSSGQENATTKDKAATSKNEAPFACDRLALNAQARKRHFDELEPALQSMRTAVRELPNGYEFQFPSDPKTIALVAEWAAGERLCCPFFEIELRMEREHGPVWLRLTGREGTKEFTKADFRSWM